MTKDDIIRMAREAGGLIDEVDWYFEYENLERFAALVYAEGHKDGLDDFEAGVLPAAIKAEREACAKVCEELEYDGYERLPRAPRMARLIRARGQ